MMLKNTQKHLDYFAQILPQYRGKPQAQKLTYMQAMCFYNTKDYNSSSYQMERFVNSYPDSEKVEEMAFLGAKSYYLMAPIYSKDSDDTKIAIDKLQLNLLMLFLILNSYRRCKQFNF